MEQETKELPDLSEVGASNEAALASQTIADSFIVHGRKQIESEGRTIPCCAGCNACCDELNYIELSEARLIVEELEKHPEALAEVIESTRAWWEKAKDDWHPDTAIR